MKLSASALTAAVLTLSACGTMFNGSSEKVFFDSNVKNVSIYDNGALLCSTPCEADITHRSSTVYLTAKKNGYETVTFRLQPETSGWFWMNILSLGLYGSTTDYASGGMYKFDHDRYYAEMVRYGSDAARAKKSKIRKFILKNYPQIQSEIADRHEYGEHLQSLSDLTGISAETLMSFGMNLSATEYAASVLSDGEEEDYQPQETIAERADTLVETAAFSKNYPDWVKLYETDGYIGQTDRNFITYIGYGESANFKQARDMATKDAYNKALAPITGYADGSRTLPLRNLKLSSEFKESQKHKFKVWQLYRYPKSQLEQDIKNYTRQNTAF